MSYQDLHDAIVPNCFNAVGLCLGDPRLDLNENLAPFLPKGSDALYKDAEGNFTATSDCLAFSWEGDNASLSPLHLAVIACYHYPNDHNTLTVLQTFVIMWQAGAMALFFVTLVPENEVS